MSRAIVVGRAIGFWDEYCAARAMGHFDHIIVVGRVGTVFRDRIDVWSSFHVSLFDKWVADRAAAGLPAASRFWGALYKGKKVGTHSDAIAPIDWVLCNGGSSGMLAVEGARAFLGCTHILLAGMPMTAEGHHAPESITDKERRDGRWVEADNYWPTWLERADLLRPYVRSMSGRTRDLFGAPDAGWLR